MEIYKRGIGRENATLNAGAVSSQIFYNGSLTYESTGGETMKLRDMINPEGVVVKTATGYTYRYFMRDYLNSVRHVSGIEQLTDYDPLGQILVYGNQNLQDNTYLYESKERYADFSDAYAGVYDFGARFYNPLYGRWFAPDPAKQGINPYIYCGNNPVMLVDPDGRFWISKQNIFRRMISFDERWLKRIEKKQQRIEERINNYDEQSNRYAKLKSQSQYDELSEEKQMVQEDLNTLMKMKEDPNYTFIAERVVLQSGDELGIYRENNNIIIQYTSKGTFGHERTHIGQSYRKGVFEFSENSNRLLNAIETENFKNTQLYDQYIRMQKINNEIEAYKFQFLIDGQFLFNTGNGFISIDKMSDITPQVITNIIGKDGKRAYNFD